MTLTHRGRTHSGKTLRPQYCPGGRPRVRVDLARVVSKYIGETEKNLSRLFNTAEHKDWIRFLDEADALFGGRTEIRDGHDRYANHEVDYCPRRMESYAGLVILGTDQRANVDEALPGASSWRKRQASRPRVPRAQKKSANCADPRSAGLDSIGSRP